ncbi:TerD family protein [Antrihabitans sp. YC2-6]|uniref:TerD family protein n=1 Tax=Antrihabitans sp. YC2-6 TaxID=2799498 RepID=UPI0018F44991|nr:TerD family protein [Antrihabitans sp. YC2-6]MBJ8347627.1 TerD family protein [Antrihabitans sp. YC2-6]
MALQMVPGQNAPLSARTLHFAATSNTALDVSALLVDVNLQAVSSDEFVFYNKPRTSGVALQSGGLTIELGEIRADASAVLCLVSVDPATAAGKSFTGLSASLADAHGTTVAAFDIPLRGGEAAVICFELYRKGDSWKVRAVGQGYAGGLAQLITTHGVVVDDQPVVVTASAPPVNLAMPAPAPAGVPLDRARAYERMWMIFEDAARSASAYISASDYAAKRLDLDLTDAIADPTMRNSPAATQARDVAHKRHDDVVAAAKVSYDADSEQLIRELHSIDPDLPRSLASWDSPVWQFGAAQPDPSDGIRLGELSAAERGALRIPFCVRLPLLRPLWLDTETSSAAAPVVASLVARIISATAPTPTLEVVDLTAALDLLTTPLTRLLGGPVVRNHSDISTRLESITNSLELAELAVRNGMPELAPPDRVVVLSDFPHGYQSEDVARIIDLAAVAQSTGLSLILVGSDESRSGDQQLAALARHCQHFPVGGTMRMLDPWTQNEWEFTPDSVPVDADRLARVMSLLDSL